MRKHIIVVIILLNLLTLSSCASWTDYDQPVVTETSIPISESGTIGQTFVAQYAGLEGIEFRLRPEDQIKGIIHVHIRSGPNMDQEVVAARISTDSFPEAGLYNFRFEPLKDSSQVYYYIFFELEGEGNLWVGSAAGHTYPDGAMYVNHKPIDQQMMFHLLYSPRFLIWGLCKEIVTWIGILIAATFIFIIPGLAISTLLFPRSDTFSIPSRLAISASLSVAIYPILFLWTDMLGIHLGSLYVWLPVLVGSIYLLWRFQVWRQSYSFIESFMNWTRSKSFLPDILLIAVLGITLFIRFFIIRSLQIPMWTDSVHHTMITQLLVTNNGLFDSWNPLAELESMTYHFGFHASSAAFHWVTGMSIPQSVLWTAQILNFFAVFTLYPLAQKAGSGKWGGITVVLIAGLLSPMPNFYVNWGRYTQLAGQVILPGVIFLIWEALEGERLNWRLVSLTWIALTGLGLTHYRVLIFAVIFFVAILLMNIRKRKAKQLLLKSVLIGLGAGLLFLPWFIHTFEGTITTNFLRRLTTPANNVPDEIREYNTLGNFSYYLPVTLWSLFAVAIGWLLLKKKRKPIVILLWWFLILLATNPQWLQLPGEGAISNFAYLITVYIPVSIILGIVFDWFVNNKISSWYKLIFILLICCTMWGASKRLYDLDYRNRTLVTTPDLHAYEWIQNNTDNRSKFLVHSIFEYEDSITVGTDGGWWLSMLANRSTTLPPMNYGVERGSYHNYREWVNALTSEIISKGITHSEVLTMLKERDVTHIYLGQLHRSRTDIRSDSIPVEILLSSADFQLIYNFDLVWIFEVVH